MHRINLEFIKTIDSGNEVVIKGLFTDNKLDNFFDQTDSSYINSANWSSSILITISDGIDDSAPEIKLNT